jgi:hypothetical protein
VNKEFWRGRPEENNHLEGLSVDGKIKLKRNFKAGDAERGQDPSDLHFATVPTNAHFHIVYFTPN